VLGHRLGACAPYVMLVHRLWSLGSVGILVIFLFFFVTGILWFSSYISHWLMDHWMMSLPYGLCADSIDFGLYLSCADCCGNFYYEGTLELLLL